MSDGDPRLASIYLNTILNRAGITSADDLNRVGLADAVYWMLRFGVELPAAETDCMRVWIFTRQCWTDDTYDSIVRGLIRNLDVGCARSLLELAYYTQANIGFTAYSEEQYGYFAGGDGDGDSSADAYQCIVDRIGVFDELLNISRKFCGLSLHKTTCSFRLMQREQFDNFGDTYQYAQLMGEDIPEGFRRFYFCDATRTKYFTGLQDVKWGLVREALMKRELPLGWEPDPHAEHFDFPVSPVNSPSSLRTFAETALDYVLRSISIHLPPVDQALSSAQAVLRNAHRVLGEWPWGKSIEWTATEPGTLLECEQQLRSLIAALPESLLSAVSGNLEDVDWDDVHIPDDEEPVIEVQGEGQPVSVFGIEKPKLSKTRYKMVCLLLEKFKQRKTLEWAEIAKLDYSGKVALDGLRALDGDWKRAIQSPGEHGGVGYKIASWALKVTSQDHAQPNTQ